MYLYIIALIFVILLIYLKGNTIEGYDDRIQNTTFEECAKKCKTIENCYGFGFDKENSICYVSKSTISGRPVYALFKDQYLYANSSCNKVQPIVIPTKNPPFADRRSNAVYVCRENENMQPAYYFHNKGKFDEIGEGRNIDSIFNVEDYSIDAYKWPINNFNVDQKDLLYKAIENQTFTPQNVTDVKRIIEYVPNPFEQLPALIKQTIPQINVKLDFGLDSIL
jgi:hypothetical protein